MWSDNETNVDYLNHSEVAEMICSMIADETLFPLSIGVYGGWGVGKSSVLQLVNKQLSEGEGTIVVQFDAWLYQDFDEAKTALMTVISQALILEAPENLKGKAKDLFKRVNKLKFLGLGAEIGMAAFGLPTFGGVSKAIGSVGDVFSGKGDKEDLDAIKGGAKQVSHQFSGLIDPKEIRSAPEEITAFKSEFTSLLNDLDKRLVVFVDNLDRCLPKTAIKNLEAMRLFLSLPKTAFVVAADVDMVRHAVAKHFSGASKKHVDDYLDKLIQFPVSVPRLGLQEVQAFIIMLVLSRSTQVSDENQEAVRTYLLTKIQNSWSDKSGFSLDEIVKTVGADEILRSQIDNALRIAPTLAHAKAILGNPRIIKRMMNVISMRHGLARRRNMELDEAVITKISIFERCTTERAFGDLLEMINASTNGKIEELSPKNLQNFLKDKANCPETWKEHNDFISEWGELLPDLSKIDLRPAVYLARETLPLQITSTSLSPDAIKAVSALLKLPSRTSQAGKTVVDSIPSSERIPIMSELISSLRQNGDWSSKRNDVNGAVMLAKAHPETLDELSRYLNSIPAPTGWLKSLIENLEKGK